eukprot:8077797-Pyramimonas_sp.AAC.1
MTAGNKGRIPPSHIVQVIGILPNKTQCRHDRVGHVWINPLYIKDNEQGNLRADNFLPEPPYEI